MKDPIRIEIRFDRGAARRLLVTGGILVLMAAGGAVFALPVSFQDGDTLKAADLNQNFDATETRLAALEAFNTHATQAGKYAAFASYCGATVATSGDLSSIYEPNLSSFARAKAACEGVTTCSPSAHVCTPEDLYRTVSTGTTAPPNGWIMGPDTCRGFTSATGVGSFWSGTGIGSDNCTDRAPVLCCN